MRSSPSRLRKGQRSGFSPWAMSLVHGEIWKTHFLHKYYSVGKTSAVRRAIREFSQGPGEVFYEAWERLRDLLRQCPYHDIPKHDITQIFYNGLGALDKYLLDAAIEGTFMSKYEDEALELIELVAENSHHHAAKSIGGRITPTKGGMLDAKAVEIGMLLDKIEKLTNAQNLIMDSLKIRPGSPGLAPVSHSDVSLYSRCSNVEHVELDCHVMAIQGPVPFRPNPMPYPGLSQAGRYHHPKEGYSNYNNPSYVQQQSGQHTSYHQPFGSAQQPMGNLRQTQFTSGFPQESILSPTVPPPITSADSIMSALAQMMSKLTNVSDRLDRVKGAKAQSYDASTDQRNEKRIELSSQPLANPRNLG